MPEAAGELLRRIEQGLLEVGVIGLGYVGLPLAEVFCRGGYSVTGFDVDQRKVDAITAGRSYIGDVTDEQVRAQVEAGRLHATTDFDRLAEMDAILICVPTPLRKTLDPDISYVLAATREIAGRLRRGQLVVLESTTYPGTTEEAVLPMLAERGLEVGRDWFLAFSPERVDPSNPKYKTENTPKVVGGVTPACSKVAAEVYRRAIPAVHPVSSARAAEMVKLLENTFRLINIGLVNEIAVICEKLGLDVWEIIDAAATKPFGFMPFYPGPGLGGHCIPIDPHYLSWKLRSLNYFTRFIDLASEINRSMPMHVVHRLTELLNDRGLPLKGSRILALGVAYKRDCADTRESPAIDVMTLLAERGARLSWYDPHVSEFSLDGTPVERVPLTAESVAAHDVVLILTDHSGVDYRLVVDNAQLVFDTRNATKQLGTDSPRVVKL
ncbi:MAG: nucleotide sugar dehydrogenase [Acidobacteria bacterium]|nr:MAG: nucleotide sugar dehydrogenase [Acidobacteriota bacterium]